MSNSNICKIINCLTAKIHRLEKQVCNNCIFSQNKGKLFNCTDEIKILHSNVSEFQANSDNNNHFIIINNKLYQYIGSNCDTEYVNLLSSLEIFKNDINTSNYEEYETNLIIFKECLSTNGISSQFNPSKNLTTSSSSDDVQSVIDELNEFYSTDVSGVCISPEEYTKCFFTRYNENFQEFIYLENNNGSTIEEKVLSGECNVLFECSTGTIYMFENGIWSSKCSLSITQPP